MWLTINLSAYNIYDCYCRGVWGDEQEGTVVSHSQAREGMIKIAVTKKQIHASYRAVISQQFLVALVVHILCVLPCQRSYVLTQLGLEWNMWGLDDFILVVEVGSGGFTRKRRCWPEAAHYCCCCWWLVCVLW